MTEDAFLIRLSAVLKVQPQDLHGQFKLDYANWDSLTVMATIAVIDAHFAISVSPKELEACSSVKDLVGLIKHKRD